ncbi:MAG: hypothetical protein ACK5X3_09590, partial [Pseudomonadota bacterium]
VAFDFFGQQFGSLGSRTNVRRRGPPQVGPLHGRTSAPPTRSKVSAGASLRRGFRISRLRSLSLHTSAMPNPSLKPTPHGRPLGRRAALVYAAARLPSTLPRGAA